MVEEKRSGFGKIIGMELAYMFLVMLLAALACFVQFIGNEYSHQTSSFIFSGDVYSYKCTYDEYKRDIVRYLTLCGYHYNEDDAISLVNDYEKFLLESFSERKTVASVATDIGYGCG